MLDPDTTVYLLTRFEDEDSGERGVTTAKTTIGALVSDCEIDPMPETLKELEHLVMDYWDETVAVLDEAAYQDRRETEISQRVEAYANALAARFKFKLNSVEFLDAVESELDRLASYREGMREDGLCIGYGVTPEQWQDEYNASQGDSHNVREVLEWVERHCPLTYLKWRETKQTE